MKSIAMKMIRATLCFRYRCMIYQIVTKKRRNLNVEVGGVPVLDVESDVLEAKVEFRVNFVATDRTVVVDRGIRSGVH